jgi:hypothetical protein
VPIFSDIDDDGSLPRAYDPETNQVSLLGTVRLLSLPDPIPELDADADIADVIAMLITLGICTQAEE